MDYGLNDNSIEYGFDFNSLPANRQGEKITFYKWLKQDGDWVGQGHPIFILQVGDSSQGSFVFVTEPILSRSEGVLQCIKQKGDLIENNDPIYIIHPVGRYELENLPTNPTFAYHLDVFKLGVPDKYLKHDFSVKSWVRQDGEFVKQGDLILILRSNVSISNDEVFNQYAERGGYLDLVDGYHSWHYGLEQNTLLYYIHDNDEKRINRKYLNIPVVQIDDFTGKKTIRWTKVGSSIWHSCGISSLSLDRRVIFVFSFNYEHDKDFIMFRFSSKEIMLKKDDIVAFLFDDGTIVQFVLTNNSYKINSDGPVKYFENKVPITDDELNQFANRRMSKWKITLKNEGREILGGQEGSTSYKSQQNLNVVINKFTKEYREVVRNEIPDYKPIDNRSQVQAAIVDSENDVCFVYLMMDTTNNYHKIGISNKPEWRERTLQGEKPTIELIAAKKFFSRKMATSFEKALHETFSSKRIRGEWFQLDDRDILEIQSTLDA